MFISFSVVMLPTSGICSFFFSEMLRFPSGQEQMEKNRKRLTEGLIVTDTVMENFKKLEWLG